MNQNDVMPPINRFRSQNPQPPNAEAGKLPPMTRPPVAPQMSGISPGVQALMALRTPNATRNQMPPGGGMAPGAQPVRPMQQYQGQPKPMPAQDWKPQQRPMPMQGQNPQPPGQIVDPGLQRRLMAFRNNVR